MTHNQRVYLWSVVALAATFAATAGILRLEGRIWFCKCWEMRFWISEPSGPHTSQHLADPYTLSHLQHGLAFYFFLIWLFPDRPSTRAAEGVTRSSRRRVLRFWVAVLLECAWEIWENSAFVINRYRTETAAVGYTGDSVWNALGDVLACVVGYVIAEWLGWRKTLALFVTIEVAMIIWIRDSLLLNVLMLVWPIEAIKTWQTGA
jgi:hypothetical protein